jgi:hypothetical protein
VTSAELISAGVRIELLVSQALQQAASDGVAKFGGHYFRWGYPMPSWLTGVFEQLISTGLLALAEQDSAGLRRVSLTPTGQLRSQQLSTLPRRVPDPAPATRGSATPAPPPAPAGHAGTHRPACGSVLIPITGARYVCALVPGHASGPDPTACTDDARTLRWWWDNTEGPTYHAKEMGADA